tara:strand:+ start:3796 stop:4200 length:405 start_codon:yes stop_codon:yes gene_type:complete
MKLIIAGGRDFSDYNLLKTEVMKFILENNGVPGNIEIISGKAKGADSLGERFSKEWNFPVIEMPADWDNLDCPQVWIKYNNQGKPYNSAAGTIRNEEMAKIATHCICFFNGSKGTANMIENAKKHNLVHKIVNY